MKKIIYSWPESQDCMDCIYGEFVFNTNGNSDYKCCIKYIKPKTGVCPMQIEKVI